jgi:hypothetical protein
VAALSGSPASSSQAAVLVPTTTSPADVTTAEISGLVTQAQRLGNEISSARSTLAQLEQVVASNAARRAASTVQAVPVSPTLVAPTTHATTGASAANSEDGSGGGSDD